MASGTEDYDLLLYINRTVHIVELCVILFCESVYFCMLFVFSYDEVEVCHFLYLENTF
jgi:hypothetical protein